MNVLHDIFGHSAMDALGWAVLHSVWQGALVALLFGGLLFVLRKKSALTRYYLAGGLLFSMALCFALTFGYYWEANSSAQTGEIAQEKAINFIVLNAKLADSEASLLETFQQYFAAHLPAISTLWFLGFTVFVTRWLGGWAYVQRLKNYRNWYAGAQAERLLHELKTQLKVSQRVEVLASAVAEVPMVIGHFRPVILIPASLLTGLDEHQLRAILAHELAHIRRWDYFVNGVQCFLEAIFFYHPVVWWLSSHMRQEREHCCDDLTLSTGAEPLAYAQALTRVAEAQLYSPQVAMALNGGKRKGPLMQRVQRIVSGDLKQSRFSDGFLVAVLIAVSFVALSFTFAWPSNAENIENILAENKSVEEKAPLSPTAPSEESKAEYLRATGPDGGEHDLIIVRNKKGKITALFVDGKKVPKKDFKKYKPLVEEALAKAEKNKAPEAPSEEVMMEVIAELESAECAEAPQVWVGKRDGDVRIHRFPSGLSSDSLQVVVEMAEARADSLAKKWEFIVNERINHDSIREVVEKRMRIFEIKADSLRQSGQSFRFFINDEDSANVDFDFDFDTDFKISFDGNLDSLLENVKTFRLHEMEELEQELSSLKTEIKILAKDGQGLHLKDLDKKIDFCRQFFKDEGIIKKGKRLQLEKVGETLLVNGEKVPPATLKKLDKQMKKEFGSSFTELFSLDGENISIKVK